MSRYIVQTVARVPVGMSQGSRLPIRPGVDGSLAWLESSPMGHASLFPSAWSLDVNLEGQSMSPRQVLLTVRAVTRRLSAPWDPSYWAQEQW
ncbi:hypothetical protein E2C01_061037 [Portunus trituberculatus]|uniref:Uncharacterized protein n=1 Tax=Portunus trituberculatus TaxID=210409 RepID=A0A5B7H730_PORTR|nr:hypothetical protein [Portunus trituberculatus]